MYSVAFAIHFYSDLISLLNSTLLILIIFYLELSFAQTFFISYIFVGPMGVRNKERLL